MEVMIKLNHEEINNLSYPVVVEMWDKVMGSFSKRRKYHATFNDKERATISRYYRKFYRWYLVSGAPEETTMRPETYRLLQRVCYFFGTV
jgi:hypothetical protein